MTGEFAPLLVQLDGLFVDCQDLGLEGRQELDHGLGLSERDLLVGQRRPECLDLGVRTGSGGRGREPVDQRRPRPLGASGGGGRVVEGVLGRCHLVVADRRRLADGGIGVLGAAADRAGVAVLECLGQGGGTTGQL